MVVVQCEQSELVCIEYKRNLDSELKKTFVISNGMKDRLHDMLRFGNKLEFFLGTEHTNVFSFVILYSIKQSPKKRKKEKRRINFNRKSSETG